MESGCFPALDDLMMRNCELQKRGSRFLQGGRLGRRRPVSQANEGCDDADNAADWDLNYDQGNIKLTNAYRGFLTFPKPQSLKA